MEKKCIYQSRGISKNMIVRWNIGICIIFFASILLCIKKRTFIATEGNSYMKGNTLVMEKLVRKTKYVLADEKQLMLAFIWFMVGLILVIALLAMRKAEVNLYEEYMEFTEFNIMVALGFISRKNMKKIRIMYEDIIDVKSESRQSKVHVSTKKEKQYHILCQKPEEMKEKLGIQLQKYCLS